MSTKLMAGAVAFLAVLFVQVGASAGEGNLRQATGSMSVTYQLNTHHDGNIADTLMPPLRPLWSRNMGAAVSYPLVVNDMVYVAVNHSGSYGNDLYGLSAVTGETVWGPIDLGGIYGFAGIAYDNNLVFAVNFSGQMPGQYAFTSPPTARAGIVYVGGAGSGGTVYAVAETDGTLLWTGSVANGDHSSPAVSDTGVYVSYACQWTRDFDPQTGQAIWTYTTGCSGGGGRTPVLYNNRLYVRDWATGHIILDAQTGTALGTFSAGPAPAFAGNLGYFLNNGNLRAVDLDTNSTVWNFSGDGSLTSAPIVVNGRVYVGTGGARLYGVNAIDGSVEYSATLPAPVAAPDEHNAVLLTGLGAGNGRLIVPASTWLGAYTNSNIPTSTTTATTTPSYTATSTATHTGTRTPTPTETTVPSATPTTCAIEFIDVPVGSTFYPFVKCLACRSIVNGYADGTYRPNNDVTRGQLAKLASGAARLVDDPGDQIFADVPPGHPFYDWINRLAARGYMSGYPCGGPGEPCDEAAKPYFRPFANATRGQTSKIVANTARIEDPIPPYQQRFEDVPPGYPFWLWIERLADRGVMGGYACGGPGEPCGPGARSYFRPNSNVTRGQAAKITSNTFFPECAGQ
jgi:outer membrane protein assembly factor BamB